MERDKDDRRASPPAAAPISKAHLSGGQRITQAPPPPPILSGSGGFHPPSTDFDYWARQAGKPDWSHWSNMAIVGFDDACYLSLDVDPVGARKLHDAATRLSKVKSRHQIAENNLGCGLPSYATEADMYYERSAGTGVKLSEFRAWGESLPAPFTFPDEFPKSATVERAVSVVPNTCWPWGDHETELLRKLAAAADKFWKLYDPTDATTAPTNDAVAAWLKTQGVADRNAQVMATILRADDLPTGPRK